MKAGPPVLAETRRALYRVEDEAVVTVVDLLRAHHACDDAVLKALTSTDKMRAILSAVATGTPALAAGRSRESAGAPHAMASSLGRAGNRPSVNEGPRRVPFPARARAVRIST